MIINDYFFVQLNPSTAMLLLSIPYYSSSVAFSSANLFSINFHSTLPQLAYFLSFSKTKLYKAKLFGFIQSLRFIKMSI